jgi:hypothetical protein
MTEEQITQVNNTARTRGAVGLNAIVPRFVAERCLRADKILNFGSGPVVPGIKDTLHSAMLKAQGFQHVDSYDVGANVHPECHVTNPLPGSYDMVFASNVFNVQPSCECLYSTLALAASLVAPDGFLILNYPKDPRYCSLSLDELYESLQRLFTPVILQRKKCLFICQKI